MRLAVIAAAIFLAACAEEPKFTKARADMTQRERDSTVAISRLPGAPVVGKALDASDAAAARAAALEAEGVK